MSWASEADAVTAPRGEVIFRIIYFVGTARPSLSNDRNHRASTAEQNYKEQMIGKIMDFPDLYLITCQRI